VTELVARSPFGAALIGMALLACMDALVKGLSDRIPTLQLVFIRFAGMALLVGVLAYWAGHTLPRRERFRGHTARAVLMVVTNATFFYALGRMPLADLFALTFTSPIFTAIIAAVFLLEPVGRRVGFAIAIGFIGMLVILLGDGGGISGDYPPLALAAALASPVTYALGIVLLRAQTAEEPVPVLVAVQAGLATVMLAPFAALDFVWPGPRDGVFLVAMVLLGTAGYLAFVSGLSHVAAARFSVVEYTGLLWAALLGSVFFAEVPPGRVWLGAAFIIGGCLLVAEGGRRQKGHDSGAAGEGAARR
jgi:S-adenosylmethionine uptake transporter